MADSQAMSTSNTYVKYHISIYENSTSIENNTSNVTVHVYFWRTNTGYTTYGTGTVYCKINGTTYSQSITPSQKITNSGITLFNMTLNIPHNADGTKTLTCSAWVSMNTPLTSDEQSYSYTLTTIPRKSSLSIGNGTLGTVQTLTVDRKNTSFTHTITFVCGNDSGTICTKSSNTSISWTPQIALANNAPNGTAVTIAVKIETFNGNTSIGSNSYTINCSIPASVKPSVSLSVSDANGYLSSYGAYIQSKSALKIIVNASGNYNSTIRGYAVNADGKSYTSGNITTTVISNSGTLTISATVTDSRGRTATASTTISVLAYSAPKITDFTVRRCAEDGTANTGGAYISVLFTGAITSLASKNTASYKIRYKKRSNTSYTDIALTAYDGQYNVSGLAAIFSADTASSYDVIVEATDAFITANVSGIGSSASKLISLLAGGLGFAIGKVAEIENLFDVNMDTHIRGAFTYEIPDVNVDFNTMTTSGKWYCGIESTNRPEEINGWLEVMRYTDNFIYQRYITHIGVIWERWKDNGTWSDWKPKVQPKYANGYWGMTIANNDGIWIRTPSPGILPYKSGGASSLGTSSWPFANIYANNIYDNGTLLENKFAAISRVGNVTHMRAGSQVVTFSGSGAKLFTDSQVNSWFGVSNSNAGNTAVFASNGDGIACDAHVESGTHQGDAWYAVIDRSFSGSVRINYLIVYWG